MGCDVVHLKNESFYFEVWLQKECRAHCFERRFSELIDKRISIVTQWSCVVDSLKLSNSVLQTKIVKSVEYTELKYKKLWMGVVRGQSEPAHSSMNCRITSSSSHPLRCRSSRYDRWVENLSSIVNPHVLGMMRWNHTSAIKSPFTGGLTTGDELLDSSALGPEINLQLYPLPFGNILDSDLHIFMAVIREPLPSCHAHDLGVVFYGHDEREKAAAKSFKNMYYQCYRKSGFCG